MKPRIIFLLNSVYTNRGGLTHASLRQASTFADAGYDTQILTFYYEPRFPVICRRLVRMGKVSDKVTIKNFYKDYGSESTDEQLLQKLCWLNDIIDEEHSKAVIVSDSRPTDALLIKLDHPEAATALRIHSNHLRNPDDPDSELNKRNRYSIENISNVDALILLTDKQRNDIVNRFGFKDKVFVIPNHYEVKTPRVRGIRSLAAYIRNYRKPERDMSKAVVITRFSSIKSIDQTIRAFKDVMTEVPDARLEIWGSGKEKKKYIQLINTLELQDNVKVNGYTQNPERIYQSAALSVTTSKAEGFSLSVMESMTNHTPVVSYDIRYGPSDMIEDGVNGYLIEKGDIETLTDTIVRMLKNPAQTWEMGEAAGHTMRTKFSKENYEHLWFSLVDELLEI